MTRHRLTHVTDCSSILCWQARESTAADEITRLLTTTDLKGGYGNDPRTDSRLLISTTKFESTWGKSDLALRAAEAEEAAPEAAAAAAGSWETAAQQLTVMPSESTPPELENPRGMAILELARAQQQHQQQYQQPQGAQPASAGAGPSSSSSAMAAPIATPHAVSPPAFGRQSSAARRAEARAAEDHAAPDTIEPGNQPASTLTFKGDEKDLIGGLTKICTFSSLQNRVPPERSLMRCSCSRVQSTGCCK